MMIVEDALREQTEEKFQGLGNGVCGGGLKKVSWGRRGGSSPPAGRGVAEVNGAGWL
eukprot:CAMPEP_0194590386 /NCGR_PEP_ID=MMETSP0292-20121207/21317_1 /TAXON_ID=39354 /ORGANISM="Heterosigma akashiwo, Strain CCMP2393" /LENGTH=56 /DNA_ID=CAMNT_0039448015 /DNA_START=252 /DNA_END=422 /DNA_ORIENTATION=-